MYNLLQTGEIFKNLIVKFVQNNIDVLLIVGVSLIFSTILVLIAMFSEEDNRC